MNSIATATESPEDRLEEAIEDGHYGLDYREAMEGNTVDRDHPMTNSTVFIDT